MNILIVLIGLSSIPVDDRLQHPAYINATQPTWFEFRRVIRWLPVCVAHYCDGRNIVRGLHGTYWGIGYAKPCYAMPGAHFYFYWYDESNLYYCLKIPRMRL